jgi:hypothetical protein
MNPEVECRLEKLPLCSDSATQAIFESSVLSPQSQVLALFHRCAAISEVGKLYNLPNDDARSHSVGEHIATVLHQLKRHPFTCRERLLAVLILFHDVEKYDEDGTRNLTDVHEEHSRAEKWLRRYAGEFALLESEIRIAVTLLHSEVLGTLMREIAPGRPSSSQKEINGRHLAALIETESTSTYAAINEAMYRSTVSSLLHEPSYSALIKTSAHRIFQQAVDCQDHPISFLRDAIAFYQCDCSAYTASAYSPAHQFKGALSMEFLFALKDGATPFSESSNYVFDPSMGRMRMRGVFEQVLRDLEDQVQLLCVRSGLNSDIDARVTLAADNNGANCYSVGGSIRRAATDVGNPFAVFAAQNFDAIGRSLSCSNFGAIVSGGQTGVDSAAFYVADSLNIPSVGFAPRGFINSGEGIPEHISSRLLDPRPPFTLLSSSETKFSRKDLFFERTELNAKYSDGTILFHFGEWT